MNNSKFRSFICIDFPQEIIKEAARIQSLIEKQNFIGKLTELENLHITLKFLGTVSIETLVEIKNKLSSINFPRLELKLSKVGTFNFEGNPRIAWIKVTGNIFALQKQIDDALSIFFPKEARFMSHLTIARVKFVKNKQGFIDYINNIKPKPLQFSTNEFKLKSSNLKPLGPVYNTLKVYKFTSSS